MKTMIKLLVCSMAVIFAGSAVAQEPSNGPTDYDQKMMEEAVEFGEQIDWYVDDGGIERDIYRDDLTGFMWEQPAEMDPSKAMTLDFIIPLITPEYVRIRRNGSSTYYYESADAIVYEGSCGSRCYGWKIVEDGYPQNVDDILAKGTSGSYDLGDNYIGQYFKVGMPSDASNYSSYYQYGIWPNPGSYKYLLSEYDDLNNYDYSSTYPEAVQFKYRSTGGYTYYTRLFWVNMPR